MDVEDTKDLGLIVEHAPNLIYVYDQVLHQNVYANRSIAETLGYSSVDIARMGTTLMREIIHPEDLPKVFAHFSDIRGLADGEVVALEYRVKHRDGRWLWMLSQDRVFRRDEAQKVTHHIGAAADITAQKVAEAKALAAQAKESVTNEELKDFAYAISHDMKAPANTIKLILSELETELGCSQDSAQGHLLELAQTATNRMHQLVEDVLHYTQIVGQKVSFDRVDLNVLFCSVTELLEADIKSHAATVSVDPMPCVKGSEAQLVILFQNLLHNALKFSRAGVAPAVKIAATPGKRASSLIVSVTDNGIGIPDERFDQIFKLFKKLGPDSLSDGTGLGLATCRRIALNHASSVALTSVVDEGSTFSVELEAA